MIVIIHISKYNTKGQGGVLDEGQRDAYNTKKPEKKKEKERR